MTIADDELKAILDGCDEPPAGPYEQRHDDEVWDARGKWFAVSSEEGAAHIARLDPDTVKAIVSELLALRQSSPPDGQTADGWTHDMASAPHDHKIAVAWVDSYSAHDPGGWKYTLGMTFWNDGHWANAPSSHWHAVAWSEFPPFTPTKAPGEEH